MLSAREAAAAVGMTKAGIIRSIHTGKLSATRNANNEFEIDPSELFRVYAPVSTTDNLTWKVAGNETIDQSEKVSMLERIIRIQEDEIADLRQRLDASQAQVSQLSAVMTQLQPPKAKTGWWQRLLGGG